MRERGTPAIIAVTAAGPKYYYYYYYDGDPVDL